MLMVFLQNKIVLKHVSNTRKVVLYTCLFFAPSERIYPPLSGVSAGKRWLIVVFSHLPGFLCTPYYHSMVGSGILVFKSLANVLETK